MKVHLFLYVVIVAAMTYMNSVANAMQPAQGTGCLEEVQSDGKIVIVCQVETDGSDGGEPVPGSPPSDPFTYRFDGWVYDIGLWFGSRNHLGWEADCAPPDTFGYLSLVDRASGGFVDGYYYCRPESGYDPPLPPPPPTQAEFWEQTRTITQLDIGTSPPADDDEYGDGWAQFPTWLWCTGNTSAALTVNTNDGWAINANVGVTSLVWRIDNDQDRIVEPVNNCGVEPDIESDGEGASLIWTPRFRGLATIGLDTTWGGTWELSYNGHSIGTYQLEPQPLPAEPIAYQISEIQSVGVPND